MHELPAKLTTAVQPCVDLSVLLSHNFLMSPQNFRKPCLKHPTRLTSTMFAFTRHFAASLGVFSIFKAVLLLSDRDEALPTPYLSLPKPTRFLPRYIVHLQKVQNLFYTAEFFAFSFAIVGLLTGLIWFSCPGGFANISETAF